MRHGTGIRRVIAVRRRTAVRALVLAVALVLAAALAELGYLGWVYGPRASRPGADEAPPHHGARVVIDPGHGGIDGGTGRPGALEKDVNLAVALKVQHLLQARGVDAALTRDRDVDLGGTGKGSRWRRDLDARLQFAANYRAALMVSLHANASRDSRERGPLVFCPPQSPEAVRLASHILNQLRAVAEPNFDRPVSAQFYVLRRAQVPGVLVEMGFLTNPGERRLLLDPEYQSRLAEAVSQGILDYLSDPLGMP